MVMVNKYGIGAAPITPQMFASAGIEHMEKYGMNTVYTTEVKEARLHMLYIYIQILLTLAYVCSTLLYTHVHVVAY